MKKFVVAVMLLAGIAGFAQEKKAVKEGAQPHKKEKVTTDEQANQLAKELNLDAKQQAKVKELYADQEKQRAAAKPEELKKGEKHDHAAMEAKIKTENEAFDKKMKGVLTNEQYTKWKESGKKQHQDKPRGKVDTAKKA